MPIGDLSDGELLARAEAAERLLIALRGIAAHEALYGPSASTLARLESAEREMRRVMAENVDLHHALVRQENPTPRPRRRLHVVR